LGGIIHEAHRFALTVELIAASKVLGRAWLIAEGSTLGVIHCGRHVCDRPCGFPIFLCLGVGLFLLAGAASEQQNRRNEQQGRNKRLSPVVAESKHSKARPAVDTPSIGTDYLLRKRYGPVSVDDAVNLARARDAAVSLALARLNVRQAA
jgi:hypothetical protein